jgi:hypothetical protein
MQTNYIYNFLTKNGFHLVENNIYKNRKCKIIIHSDCYEVKLKFKYSAHSDNLNIYWLIGYLTYYNLIDKDYKK